MTKKEFIRHRKKTIAVVIIAILAFAAILTIAIIAGIYLYDNRELSTEEMVDMYHETITMMKSYDIDHNSDEEEKISKNLKKLGLWYSSTEEYDSTDDVDEKVLYRSLLDDENNVSIIDVANKYLGYKSKLNADVIKCYTDKYSSQDFIDSLLTMQSYFDTGEFDEHGNYPDYHCRCAIVADLFQTYFSTSDLDMVHLSELEEGCDGYYTEHPEAEPQNSSAERTITGKFNDADDGNSVYSSSENVSDTIEVVGYYGDFAITKEITHGYDEGRYEWVNGTFYDEPAHFTTSTNYKLYYKGEEIGTLDEPVMPNGYFYEYNGNNKIVCLNSLKSKALGWNDEEDKWEYYYVKHFYITYM